jgi:hypothetical protein
LILRKAIDGVTLEVKQLKGKNNSALNESFERIATQLSMTEKGIPIEKEKDTDSNPSFKRIIKPSNIRNQQELAEFSIIKSQGDEGHCMFESFANHLNRKFKDVRAIYVDVLIEYQNLSLGELKKLGCDMSFGSDVDIDLKTFFETYYQRNFSEICKAFTEGEWDDLNTLQILSFVLKVTIVVHPIFIHGLGDQIVINNSTAGTDVIHLLYHGENVHFGHYDLLEMDLTGVLTSEFSSKLNLNK